MYKHCVCRIILLGVNAYPFPFFFRMQDRGYTRPLCQLLALASLPFLLFFFVLLHVFLYLLQISWNFCPPRFVLCNDGMHESVVRLPRGPRTAGTEAGRIRTAGVEEQGIPTDDLWPFLPTNCLLRANQGDALVAAKSPRHELRYDGARRGWG